MRERGNMSNRGGGNTRETHVNSNEGGGQEESGAQDNNNKNNGSQSRGRLPPQRGAIGRKIFQDIWGSSSSPGTTPSTKDN